MMPSKKYGRALPFAKVLRHILAKVAWHILAKLAERFLLQKWPGTSQKVGPGWIFSLPNPVPSSQHLGKKSWAEGVEVQREVFPPRELKFNGRYVNRVLNIRIFENSKIV
ncbi:hypothetical protein L3X38_018899 [Prunus dulcis]|uniref:Uncharacterized protein n=1 Tax=Prunus dulcis TaxID=3755 RepID=A0AAD4WC46_PRUDU|nr:hypothetical protein L3X38_018899 [Prunus dulcis]